MDLRGLEGCTRGPQPLPGLLGYLLCPARGLCRAGLACRGGSVSLSPSSSEAPAPWDTCVLEEGREEPLNLVAGTSCPYFQPRWDGDSFWWG